MTDTLKDCVFAMKRLSDYTAGIIDPYKVSTIRKSSESLSQFIARCNEKKDRDINTLIESLFFFINSEQERSKDAKRIEWIERELMPLFLRKELEFRCGVTSGEYFTIRELIDQAIAEETARTLPAQSESQTSLPLETDLGQSKTGRNESSQDG